MLLKHKIMQTYDKHNKKPHILKKHKRKKNTESKQCTIQLSKIFHDNCCTV